MGDKLIYVTEDNQDISEMERYALESSGYRVECFISGEDMLERISQMVPDLVLLDIMLPGADGLDIMKKLRLSEATLKVPVIMASAKGMEIDKVKALDLGADDYIVKPFGIMEMVSRVKALLRRTNTHTEDAAVCGSISVYRDKHLVRVEGAVVELTYKEFKLLLYLIENKGIVLSREKIMDKVWGFDYEGESRTVDMHIKTLRQKLLAAGGLIHTVRNVGYQIDDN